MGGSPGWRRGRPLPHPPLRPEDAGLRLAPPRTRPTGNIVWTAFPVEPAARPTGSGEPLSLDLTPGGGGNRIAERRHLW